MFNKSNFDEIPYLDFDENFKIELKEKSQIVFGYNGIGKSSIYKSIKTNFPDYDFLDYGDTKDSFIKNKKDVIIGAKIQVISKLKAKNEELHANNNIETTLKKYSYTSQPKAKEVSTILAKVQKDKKIDSIDISEENIERINKTVTISNRKNFFDKFMKIKEISDINLEIESLKKVYLSKAYEALFDSINDKETTCPACDTKGIHNLKDKFQNKKQLYEKNKEAIFSDFSFEDSRQKEDIINQIVILCSKLTEQDLVDYIICDGSVDNKNRIANNLKSISENNKKIKELEQKLEIYYNNIKKEKTNIEEYFKEKFDIATIKFNDATKEISIKFKREVETYSEGEIHLIILLFKLYEFKINDNEILIMDDPLSSYDLINQYKSLFEIVNTVSEDKRILIFTHNIEMINIINSQNSNAFEYKYIEKYKGIRFIQNIYLNANDSILSLKNLLLEDTEEYLKLLIERESANEDNFHKVFHYDEPFIIEDGKFKGKTNQYFVDLIDLFDSNLIINNNFVTNTYNKVIYLCAIRVWIESKFYEVLSKDKDMISICNDLKGKEFSKKINRLLPRNAESLLIKYYPKLTRVFLMNKKVMLNQNEHYQSQIIPFNYALNISLDDLMSEITEIKEKFL